MSLPLPKSLEMSSDNRGTSWDLFKQTWNNYELATGLVNKPEEQRVATLLSIIGNDALQVYNAFHWSTNERQTIENILMKFEGYCKPKKNVTYERFLFMSRKQKPSEPFCDYVVALRNSVKNCEYGPLTDSLVRDAIVMGVRSKKTQQALLKENDLSLDSCINIARATERAYEHFNTISNGKEEFMEVDKVSNEIKPGKCKFCGLVHVWKKDKCPAYGKKCDKCGGLNHFKKVCRSKYRTSKEINEVDNSELKREEILFE